MARESWLALGLLTQDAHPTEGLDWQGRGAMGRRPILRATGCRGLRRSSKDDWKALARGALIYDALYAELSAEKIPNTQGV